MIKQGTLLDSRYKIKEKLGAGGGGIIYRAYDQRLHIDVVVKQIREEIRGRIVGRSEADVLKQLRHTYLPRVYDFLELEEGVYTVMDFIPGQNLRQALMSHGPFDQKTVLKWGRQLSEALSYLHSLKPPVIHSDIKPDNIMLQPNGDICLIDFNISLALDAGNRTSVGISPGFSPPEQYNSLELYSEKTGIGRHLVTEEQQKNNSEQRDRTADDTVMVTADVGGRSQKTRKLNQTIPGQRGERSLADQTTVLMRIIGRGIDERSDIYSLGATLFCLLTGDRPAGISWEMNLHKKAEGKLSEGFLSILRRMLEVDPSLRFQNGAELKSAFDHIYELDSVYRRYRTVEKVRTTLVISLFCLSLAMIAVGRMEMGREVGNRYNELLEEARICMEQGEAEQAKRLIQESRNLIPDRIDAYEAETRRLYEIGDYETCIRYGTGCINSPEYQINQKADKEIRASLFYLVGNARYELGDLNDAISCLQNAVNIDPDNSFYYRDLAVFLAKTGNTDEAKRQLDAAEERGLGKDSIYLAEGEIAYGEGKFEEALTAFQKTLTITKDPIMQRRCVLLCAEAYEKLGKDYAEREIEFLTSWEGTITTGGDQSEELLAAAYARIGVYDKAIEKISGMVDRGNATFRTYENLAVLYQQAGELDRAGETLEKMNKMYPDRYETFKRLAFLEADLQSRKPNEQRDYHLMQQYYMQATELYKENDDEEMQRLEGILEDLRKGKWFD